jgi:hypothetical protein
VPPVVWKNFVNVSPESIAYIFRVEDIESKERTGKQLA